MRLRSLEVRCFRAVHHVRVEFGDGLNVLYGPNELGKSTLVEALRAAFLLPVTSKAAEEFVPWGTDEVPQVIVEFELSNGAESEGIATSMTRWRIRKSFDGGSRGTSLLERELGPGRFTKEASGRDVDGKLRSLLNWGVQEPGGKGAPKGWPKSYLVTALLGEQDKVTEIFDASLDDDSALSGRDRLTAALGIHEAAGSTEWASERGLHGHAPKTCNEGFAAVQDD